VVLVIIGVLAALIVPNVLERRRRRAPRRRDRRQNLTAAQLYRLDNQRYPTQRAGLQALVANPPPAPAAPNWKPYVDKLPNDPWAAYQYLNPGVKGEVDVMSFGADGVAAARARMPTSVAGNKGFTLLELLVVVAIIAWRRPA